MIIKLALNFENSEAGDIINHVTGKDFSSKDDRIIVVITAKLLLEKFRRKFMNRSSNDRSILGRVMELQA